MAIVRIINRLFLRKLLPFPPPQCYSTDTGDAAAAAAAQPNGRNSLFKLVVSRSADSNIADVLNEWEAKGNQVKRTVLFNLGIYFRNRKNYRAALQMYDWLDNSKLELNNANQATRIDLLYKTEGVASARKYFNSLQESEKTNKTYGALLSCYCKEKLLDEALEVFEHMKEMKYLSSLNYNNVISLFNSMGHFDKTISLVREMEEKIIAPDTFTYNMLINSYGALKNFDGMEEVLKKMKSSEVNINHFTYGNLATIYFNSGLHEKVDAILEIMKQMEIQPDKSGIEGCYTMLKLYSMMNNLSGINQIWEALKSTSPTPSNTSYLMMLLALAKVGDLENLEKVYKEWEEGCSVFDFRLPNVLLEYYLGHDMIEEATSLYEKLESIVGEPNMRTMSLFSNLCIKNGQIDLALKYLEMGLGMRLDDSKLRRNKWFPTDETVAMFANYLEANNDTDKAEKFNQLMKKHGIEAFDART